VPALFKLFVKRERPQQVSYRILPNFVEFLVGRLDLGSRDRILQMRHHGRAMGSGGAVDRDLKGCANGAHPNVGKSAKPADQDCDGHTFHGVQVHGRTAGDRVGIGFKYNLTG
jgi:hypothetical protein